MKKIAILLSTYNGECFIEEQLRSIFNQSYQNFSLFVRDDGSNDKTVTILNNYSKRHDNMFFQEDANCRNLGASLSFMKLLESVDADYYVFCDQDDIWDKDKLKIQLNTIAKHDVKYTNIPIVAFHDLVLMNKKGQIINNSFWSLREIFVESVQFESIFVKNVITGCAAMINNQMKSEILKCKHQNILMYDHLIALIGYSFGRAIPINKGLILYRDHESSVTPKAKIKFEHRVLNLINNFNRKDYLLPHILQLEEFLEVFHNYLNQYQINSLKMFIAKKKLSPFIRFLSLKVKGI